MRRHNGFYSTVVFFPTYSNLTVADLHRQISDACPHHWQSFCSLPRANAVWGKVMFLHTSVILSTGGGLYDVTSWLAAWSHVPSRGSLSLVPCSFWGISVQGWSVEFIMKHCIRKAGSTHPTGMLYCFHAVFQEKFGWIIGYHPSYP